MVNVPFRYLGRAERKAVVAYTLVANDAREDFEHYAWGVEFTDGNTAVVVKGDKIGIAHGPLKGDPLQRAN